MALHRLEEIFRKLSILGEASSVLSWDSNTMMPDGAAHARAEQMALLAAISHQMITAPEIPDLLDAAQTQASDPWEQANLREMRRQWVHAAALPEDLVIAQSKAASACETLWRQARPAGDFAMVRDALAEVLNLSRQAAAAKAEALGTGLYDALLDQYEPDGRIDDIEAVFADLEDFLPGFLSDVMDRQGTVPPLPAGPFPVAAQQALGRQFMEILGFDFQHGRLDISLHPFCGGTPDDVRLTTRYDEGNFASAFMGVMHETGHALYEMGLPKGRWRHQPVAGARGMQLHESQSLLMEMQVGRSLPFVRFAAPRWQAAFGGQDADWQAKTLHQSLIRVQPGFIRVEADEVTYPAHVIIRTRLERALIEDRMSLKDLPAAWNEAYQRLLGITPPNDRLGCLQDIHWFDGAWGYFPTYTLGAMSAAQLFDAARRADATILPAIELGDFRPLLSWLRTHVHGRGSVAPTRQILAEATGQPLNAEIFKDHLRQRYLGP